VLGNQFNLESKFYSQFIYLKTENCNFCSSFILYRVIISYINFLFNSSLDFDHLFYELRTKRN